MRHITRIDPGSGGAAPERKSIGDVLDGKPQAPVFVPFWEKPNSGQRSAPLPEEPPATLPDDGIDRRTGAPASVRASLDFLPKREGQISYLESIYGVGNARHTDDGELIFLNPDTQQWTAVDEDRATWRDVADLAGDAVELLPAILGSAAGPAGAAAGSAVGTALRVGMGKALPGDSGMSLGEAALRTGASAAGGAALGTANKAARNLIPNVRNAVNQIPSRSPEPMISLMPEADAALARKAAETGLETGGSIGIGDLLNHWFIRSERQSR